MDKIKSDRIAIIGENNSGKTSLAKYLCRESLAEGYKVYQYCSESYPTLKDYVTDIITSMESLELMVNNAIDPKTIVVVVDEIDKLTEDEINTIWGMFPCNVLVTGFKEDKFYLDSDETNYLEIKEGKVISRDFSADINPILDNIHGGSKDA